MKNRLQLLLQKYNISASKLAEMIDVQPSGISHILSGRNNPSMDFVVKCLNAFPDINPEWFIMGVGDMYKTAPVVVVENPETNSDNTPEKSHSPLKSPSDANRLNPTNFTYSNTSNNHAKQLVDQHKQNIKNSTDLVVDSVHNISESVAPATSLNKKISKVMIFYSDHTVESFDYSDSDN